MKKIIIAFFCLSYIISKSQSDYLCFETISNDSIASIAYQALTVNTHDFNSDGIEDLVIGEGNNPNGSGTIAIYMGYGNGVFKAPITYTTNSYPTTIVIKDINSDGKVDLVVSYLYSSSLHAFYGTGNGNFNSGQNFGTTWGRQPGSVISADFNGDGRPDLASPCTISSNIIVWKNTASGMGFATYYYVGSMQRSITYADFNGDGKMDLATANRFTSNVTILIGSGTGSFTALTTYSIGTSIAGSDPAWITTGDFNMDGNADLAVTTNSNTVSVLIGSGTGTFAISGSYSVGVDPRFITVGDFNIDGKLDLATANYGSNNVSILIGTGAGTFGTAINCDVGKKPRYISMGDYNSDGNIDLSVANEQHDKVSILIGSGNGVFKTRIINSVGGNQNSSAAGDFNGDGYSDIAVANFATDDISIYTGTGTSTFVTAGNYSVGSQPTSVATGDFNGDGIADLASTNNNSDNVSVLMGNTIPGTFMAAVNYSAGLAPYCVVTGDFNTDGIIDLVTANYESNNVSVMIGTGSGTFLSPVNYSVQSSPVGLVTGDFNIDGVTDLAVINFGSNSCSILIGNGIGTFSNTINYAIAMNPVAITKGDFNSDGIIDLVISSQWQDFSILTGTGTGAFTITSNYLSSGLCLKPIISGDFNSDGNSDLAMVGRMSNDIVIMRGNGSNSFYPQIIYADSLGPVSIAASDVNNDGKMDIVATNNYSHSLITLLNQNEPAISITGSTNLCKGSSGILIPSGVQTYTWNGGVLCDTVIVNPLSTKNYTVYGTDALGCSTSQTITVIVDSTCTDVWPGDANSDGIADNLDVLELGLHYTQLGPARATVSNSWQSYFSNNWTGTITNGKNLNHSDCNGDGIINASDTLAIYNNYGLTHTFKTAETNTVNPQLSIVPDQASVANGLWGTASIYIGNATTNVTNINGLAFTVSFNNLLIEPNSIYIEYQNSFINSSQNLHFRKLDFANGKIYTATTHTINNNVSGFGKIATLHYKINSALTGDDTLIISLVSPKKSDALGTVVPLTSGSCSITTLAVGLKEWESINLITVGPNPTNGLITINSSTNLQKIEVVAITGQVLMTETAARNYYNFNIDTLSNGIYFINFYQNNRIIKIEKVVLNK